MKAVCPQCPSPLRVTLCKPVTLVSPEQIFCPHQTLAAGTYPTCDLSKEPRLPIMPTSLKEFNLLTRVLASIAPQGGVLITGNPVYAVTKNTSTNKAVPGTRIAALTVGFMEGM